MSIPFNDNLLWNSYVSNPNWFQDASEARAEPGLESQRRRAIDELYAQTFGQPLVLGVQFMRDAARLVLKVPVRSVWTPVLLPKNWRQRERAKANAKLAGYSFVQLVFVPVKFTVALAALLTTAASTDRARGLLDSSAQWTVYLDGRASQLEALKEVGRKKASERHEYLEYKEWLYSIDPADCRKEDPVEE